MTNKRTGDDTIRLLILLYQRSAVFPRSVG